MSQKKQLPIKKAWSMPTLIEYGTVGQITQQINKLVGSQDNLINIQNSDITVGYS